MFKNGFTSLLFHQWFLLFHILAQHLILSFFNIWQKVWVYHSGLCGFHLNFSISHERTPFSSKFWILGYLIDLALLTEKPSFPHSSAGHLRHKAGVLMSVCLGDLYSV